jgi:hypothetical protein
LNINSRRKNHPELPPERQMDIAANILWVGGHCPGAGFVYSKTYEHLAKVLKFYKLVIN